MPGVKLMSHCVFCVCACVRVHVCVLPLTVGTTTCLEMGWGFDGVCVYLKVRETLCNGTKVED